MQSKDSAETLIHRLGQGWTADHCGLAQEFIRRLKENLGARGEIGQIGENTLQFTLDLSDIRLRGMENVACLLVGGEDSNLTAAVKDFWNKASDPGRVVCVLAASSQAYDFCTQAIAQSRRLILKPDRLREWLEATDAQAFLKLRLREQLSRRQLIPYGILLPVQGHMFYGRQNDLSRLIEEPDVSFAIAGPGRLGKTSLILEYRRLLTATRDNRATRRYYINFYDCTNTSSDGVARFISMHIESSQRSDRVNQQTLMQFLRRHQALQNGPLELLLDEVDLVCESEAFKIIARAARMGICRLVLCGRGVLLNTILRAESFLECRMDLMRLKPLDPGSARKLILDPLSDLGMKIEEQDRLIERLFQLSGRMPHLLQYYCKKLANLAIDEGDFAVNPKLLETLNWDYETAQYFISSLGDLSNPESRLVAFALMKSNIESLTASHVRELALEYGVTLTLDRVVEICNDLFINNVLNWENGFFRLANGAIKHYVREMKLLDGSIQDALRMMKTQSL